MCDRLLKLAAALVLTVLLVTTVHAQDAGQQTGQDAALLRIAYFDVEVRWANTETWFPIQRGAEFPVSAGDSIRTTNVGRANLLWTTAGDGLTVILPGTTVTVDTLTPDAIGLTLERGAIVTGLPDARTLTISTPTGVLTGALTQAAVQVAVSGDQVDTPMVDTTALIVGGAGTFTTPTGTYRLGEGDGGVFTPLGAFTGTLPALPNFTQFQAALVGCPGVVAARGAVNLNVRVGPLFDYDELGVIRNGEPVRVVGITEFGERLRVAYRSSYGWVITEGVQADCAGVTLPVFPYSQIETSTAVIDPLPDELAVLQPFFGPVEGDLWFYR